VNALVATPLHAIAEPTVLRGAVAGWPAARWTFASLAERAGDAVVPVHTGRWKPAGWRVSRDGRTTQRRAADFLSALAAGRPDGYLAGLELLREVPSLRADLDFPALGLIAADVAWIGPAGTATPIHFDLAPNLYAQLAGSKRWRLWRPERRLGPRFAGFGGFAMSRLDAGRGVEAAGPPDFDWQLDPGDLLVLPSGWWHRVDTLSDAIAVNRWWRFHALGRLLRPSRRRA
jgi:hypothetical protein